MTSKRTMTNHLFIGGRHAPAGLISRVADCCLWFGRYVERAEAMARHLQATLHLGLDGELSPEQAWSPAIIVAGELAEFTAKVGVPDGEPYGERVQRYLVWDESCGVSLVRSLVAARENARSIREVLSGDVWEVVNEAYLWIKSDDALHMWRDHRDGFYRRVRQMTQLALGLMRSTMLHDAALDFIWLGVMLERTNQTARLLDVQHHAFEGAATDNDVVATSVWVALLRACSGVEPFMKSHAGRVTPDAVATFLVTDARFPRSIAYSIHAAYERFVYLRPPTDVNLPGGESLIKLARLDQWVQVLTADELHNSGLHQVLTRIVDETAAIGMTIGKELLGYGPAPEAQTQTQTQG